MEKTTGYLSRAWHDLTSDKGWWQPVAILTLVGLIPIVGSLIVLGYLLDWGREAAWGMSRSLPRTVGSVGKRLKWGFSAFVILLCWVIPLSIVGGLFGIIPLIGWLIAIAAEVCCLVAATIGCAACIRMTIYDRIKGGLQFSRILKMARLDPSGLACCFGVSLLSAVPAIIGSILIMIGVLPAVGLIGLAGSEPSGMLSSGVAVAAGLGATAIGGLFAAVVAVAIQFFSVAAQSLAYRSFGYWVGQFQPAKWGGIEEPMPFEPGYRARSHAAPSQEPAATSFQDVAAAAGAAAATAGAYVKEHAGQAAEAVTEAAAGFKAEHVEPDETRDEPLEAQVVSVENAASTQLEEPAQGDAGEAAAAEEPASAEPAEDAEEQAEPVRCASCGAAAQPHHKFCTNCGQPL